jgi:hypothetical protein
MKKSQKESIRKGGEMARGIYQTFMAMPDWMTYIDKGALISFLKTAIESEEIIIQAMDKMSEAPAKEQSITELQRDAKILRSSIERGYNLSEARFLLSLFEGKQYFLGEPKIVHADFSMYCRDN